MDSYSIYRRLPYQLQNILCSIYGYQRKRERYGKQYEQIFSSLLDSDYWSAEQIKAYKEEHLYKIIEYAYNNCPYYTKKYNEGGVSPSTFTGLESLEKFPILTKDEVRIHWKEIMSKTYDPRKLIECHTSGSSGKSLDVKTTMYDAQFYWATVWRGRHRFGVRKEDTHLNLTGKPVAPIETSSLPYWRFNAPMHQYMLNMHHVSAEKIVDIANFIENKKFTCFVGYASIMNTLAVLLDECNIKIDNPPKYIFSSGEKMYDNQRVAIEKVFHNTKIMEHYGFAENAGSASKCECGYYHEDFELGHFELHNAEESKFGLTGELLATGFHNYGMPFIRYQIGDTATFSKKQCTCGRHSLMINAIEGRNGDYIITPEGVSIARTSYLFKETLDIKECQVVQSRLGEITLKIVKRDSFQLSTEDNLRKKIAEMISPTIKVNFEYVLEIPRTSAGKFKQVVSEL